MVKTIRKNKGEYFQCEECLFLYKEEKWAKRCEGWCKRHQSCNLEITKYAVKEEG